MEGAKTLGEIEDGDTYKREASVGFGACQIFLVDGIRKCGIMSDLNFWGNGV